MSLLGPKTMHKEKTHHPWEKSIKAMYSDRYKYVHNSVKNPTYQKKKKPLKDRIKFTVIGNRVTKEFIYCVNIVKGIHKYRSKVFAPPVIQGVNGVEWPTMLNALKIKYSNYCITNNVVILCNDELFGGEQELKEFIESRYIYNLCLDYGKLAVEEFARYVLSTGRPFAYLHITINDEEVGSLIFKLYSDLVPCTCENFLRLCTTKRGGYGGSPIHRIVKDGWVQCGGYKLKKSDLSCENFIVPHDRRGVLAMCNDGRHVDCSTQFFILLQPALWMANKYVAFGQLVDGENTLQQIERVPTMYESPTESIIIYSAGVLNLDCKDIHINKNIRSYLYKHIEDLVAAGQVFYEALLHHVWAEIAARSAKREQVSIISSDVEITDSDSGTSSTQNSPTTSEPRDQPVDLPRRYEPEEEPIIERPRTVPLLAEVQEPYYLPFTDVPYPDETDSTYDLKKFLQGHYCLFCDLEEDLPKDEKEKQKIIINYSNIPSDMLLFEDNVKIDSDLDTDEEEAIQNYIKNNVDRVSFAGGIIRNIGKGTAMFNLFEGARKSEMINFTEDDLKRFRRISMFERRQSMATRKSEMVTLNDEDLRRLKQMSAFERRQSTVQRKSQLPGLDEDHLKKLRRMSVLDREQTSATNRRQSMFERRQSIFDPLGQRKSVSAGGLTEEQIKKLRRISTFDHQPDDLPDMEDEGKHIISFGEKSSQPPSDDLPRTSSKLRRPTGFAKPEEMAKILAMQKQEEDEESDDIPDLAKPDVVKMAIFPPIKRQDSQMSAEEKDVSTASFIKETPFVFTPSRQKHKVDGGDSPDIAAPIRKSIGVEGGRPPPDELNRTPSKLMRRPTGYIHPDEIQKILAAQNRIDPNDDEEEEEEPPKLSTGSAANQRKSIIIDSGGQALPDDLNRTASKLMRRPTGFIRPDEIKRILASQNRADEDEEDEEDEEPPELSTSAPDKKQPIAFAGPGSTMPDDLNRTPSKLMRRPTGFIRPDEIKRILAAQKKDEDDEDEENVLEPAKIPSRTPSTTSKVSMISLEDLKKRRQTAFTQELTKVKIYQRDKHSSPSSEESEEDKKVSMRLPSIAPQDTHKEIKRRQTGYMRPEDMDNLNFNRDEEEEEEEETKASIKIKVPQGEKDVHREIKRRQTGFVRKEEIQNILDKEQDDDEEDEEEDVVYTQVVQEGHLKLKIREGIDDMPTKIKRRQTGYVRKSQVARTLAPLLEDLENEETDGKQRPMKSAQDDELEQAKTLGPEATDKIAKDKSDPIPTRTDAEPAAAASKKGQRPLRRSTATDSDAALRESVIRRLYEDAMQIADDAEPPTLKNYRPISERIPKNLLLSFGQRKLPKTESKNDAKSYMRQSLTIDESFEEVANVQYGKRVNSKISQDYIPRLHQMEQEPRDVSFRSIEYANRRPCISVAEYQRRNKERQEKIRQDERKKRDKKLSEVTLPKQLLSKD